ncbi:MAG: hypothetical protein H7061_08590 [Bdellovibrionaceae bacterium]|nr:hypothetical protein [Bdellovibrio sp.]
MSHWIVRTNDFKYARLLGNSEVVTRSAILGPSLKKLLIFSGLALVSVFIPVLHFFLVPGLLITGLFVFFTQFKNTHYLPTGTYKCPSCEIQSSVNNFYFHIDSKVSCNQCGRQLSIRPAEDLTTM